MNKNKKLMNYGGHIIVAFSYVLVFAISVAAITYRICTPDRFCVTQLSDVWTDENGEAFSLRNFNATTKDGPVPQRVYYTTMVTDIDSAVIFRTRNCFANIYINGRLAYEDDTDIATIYGSSSGSRWHNIAIDISDEPVEICLEVTAAYYNTNGLIDNIYLGKAHDVMRIITTTRVPGFILSTSLHLAGVILLVLYFYLKKRFNVGKDFLYLGVSTFFAAQWSSSESLLWQLFFGYSEVFHLLGYLSLAAIPLSFGLFACYRLKGGFQRFSQIYSLVACANLIAVIVLHVTGIFEFHYSLGFTHLLIVILVPALIKTMLSYTSEAERKNNMFLYNLLAIFVICLIIAFVKYYNGSYGNYSTYIRISLLCFLFELIFYQLNQTANTFSKGLQADMMHNLALTDHMTQCLNRTALAEHTEEYNHMIDSFSPLGIVQFDVNNLKKVNDTLGHEKGDQMIMAVAEGLHKAFPESVDIYRTGGDEFLAVINCLDPEGVYEAGVKKLDAYCEEQNARPDLGFKLQIARGFKLIKGNATLEEAIEEADALMYENKRILKRL